MAHRQLGTFKKQSSLRRILLLLLLLLLLVFLLLLLRRLISPQHSVQQRSLLLRLLCACGYGGGLGIKGVRNLKLEPGNRSGGQGGCRCC
jgi:hypothetical protein